MQQYNAHTLFERSGVDWDTSELHEVIDKLKLNKILERIKKVPTPDSNPFDLLPLKVQDSGGEIDNKNVYIVGGAIRRTLMHQSLTTDIDLMFGSDIVFQAFVDQFDHEINEGDISCRIPTDIDYKQTSKHYVNFNLDVLTKKTDALERYKIQCINFAFFSDIEPCLDSFDYSIAQFGIKLSDLNTVYAGDYSLWDLARKRLVVNKITYPVASVRRLLKYKDQGFTVCNGCIQQTLQQTVDLAMDNEGIFSREFHYVD